jgi:hypothetical protein
MRERRPGDWVPLDPIPPGPYKLSVPLANSEMDIAKSWGYKPREWFAETRAMRAMVLGHADETAKTEYWIGVWSRPPKSS